MFRYCCRHNLSCYKYLYTFKTPCIYYGDQFDSKSDFKLRTSSPIITLLEIRMDHVESSSHKYEHTNGDNKSLLSQALEKSGSRDEREERDSVSDDDRDSEERAGSASIDTIKSDMNSRDCEPPTTPIFPPGLEALYRQAGFPPFLGLGGQHHGGGLAGPSVTHVGLQSHAANPTGKERASKSSINKKYQICASC